MWSSRGPANLDCDFPLRDPVPVDGLFGETWIGADATLTVEYVDGGEPLDRTERERAWIPVAGSERDRKPVTRFAIDDVAITGPDICNTVLWTNNARSQYGNPMTFDWEFEVFQSDGSSEIWTTSTEAEPELKFPPGASVLATMTATDAVNGLSDYDQEFHNLVTDCDPPPPPGAGSEVIIEATDDSASEAGPDTGTWTLTRTSDELPSLTVTVSLSGSATGADYAPIELSVTFEQGETTATVDLTPVDDAAVEGTESATMTIEPGDGYTVGDPDHATITITDDDEATTTPRPCRRHTTTTTTTTSPPQPPISIPDLDPPADPDAPDIGLAECPTDGADDDTLRDSGNVHSAAVGCLALWGITDDAPEAYIPSDPVTRGQLAGFLARLATALGIELPTGPDAFGDDDGNVHEAAINALAARGIFQGDDGLVSPGSPVTRGQMASILVRLWAVLTGDELPAGPDAFGDDDGNVHEAAIDALAAAGITQGTEHGYDPDAPVRGDQMATFLTRLVQRLRVNG